MKISARPCCALQVAQQVQVLRLDREVEAGGRLVGDQQPRLAGDADGADDALAHAARHLVRDTATRASRGEGMRTAFSSSARPAPGAGAAGALVHADRLRHLVADGEQRVQRGHRVLQDHGDALAAHAAHLGVGLVAAGPRPRTASRPPTMRAAGGSRRRMVSASVLLPRAGLADDAQRLARVQAEARRRRPRAPRGCPARRRSGSERLSSSSSSGCDDMTAFRADAAAGRA